MILNPNEKVVIAIRSRLQMTGNQCPCLPPEKWNEDTLCECKAMREQNHCCCTLYVLEEGETDLVTGYTKPVQ